MSLNKDYFQAISNRDDLKDSKCTELLFGKYKNASES